MTAIDLQDIDTRCISDESRPWLPLAPYAGLASMKLLAVDPERAAAIFVLRASPGIEMPRHESTGPTTLYTVQGRWKYRERDWVAGPGSLVVEPAGACNTALVLGDGTDDAIVLVHATGETQYLDEAGRAVGVENWHSVLERYLAYCRTHGLRPAEQLAGATYARPPGCTSGGTEDGRTSR